MAKIDINNIEKVEGKYHMMFDEGKNMVESAISEIRMAWLFLLMFAALILIFIVISGFNLFYLGFAAIFLIVFFVVYCLMKRQKRQGKKQCVYAVQNSHTSEIVNRQIDVRKRSKIVSRSVSNKIDRYDKSESHSQKKLRRQKQRQLTSKIRSFEKESKK